MEQDNVWIVTSGNVFGAEGCAVSQISSLKNVPAEAEILAGYTRFALITVQGNILSRGTYIYVCICVWGGESQSEEETETYNSEKEVPVGIWLQHWWR